MIEFTDGNYAYGGSEKYFKYIQIANLTEDGHYGKSVGINVFPDHVCFLPYCFNDPSKKLFKVAIDKDCIIYNELKKLTVQDFNEYGSVRNAEITDEATGSNNMRLREIENGQLSFSFSLESHTYPESITILKENNPNFYKTVEAVVDSALEKIEEHYNSQQK